MSVILNDRYRIETEVGRGGMGIVFRAHDLLLDRVVALKILASTALGPAGRQRFLHEAKAAATLNHPNIVAVYDVGEAEHEPFIVMELVDGQSLRKSIAQLSLPDVVHLARQVCAALDHAHSHKIIHRDLKPENILLTHHQTAKLVDFGLARLSGIQRLTDTNAVVGTFWYMAPEQARGDEIDGRADMYALGVILYEMTTGRRPFNADDTRALVAQLLHAPVTPPSTYGPELPPALDALIVRLLSKKPEDRPASAAEVRARLDRLAPSVSVPSLEEVAQAPNICRLLLVDDNAFTREGMSLYFRREGLEVQEAGDEETAWQMAQAQPPDAAVIDISLPPNPDSPSRTDLNYGVRLAQHLKAAYPAMGVVLFSAHPDRGREVFDMVREGVRGLAYKLKGSPPSALLAAIRDVLAGRVVIDPEVRAGEQGLADELLKRLTPEERSWVEIAVANFDQLTLREQELADRLAAAHNTEGIARAMGITSKSAENYITHVYDKLGLNEMGRAAPHLRKVVVLAKACMINDLRAGGDGI